MARIYRPRVAFQTLFSGAVGGAVAGSVALGALTALEWVRGAPPTPLVVPNVVGAWVVRWLQTAQPDALQHFYPDATVGGFLTAAVVGAAVGAAFAGLMDRLPHDHPMAWGVMTGLVLWVVSWWQLLPALDPVAIRVLAPLDWLGAMLLYGGLLGVWVHGDRDVWSVRGGGPTPRQARTHSQTARERPPVVY